MARTKISLGDFIAQQKRDITRQGDTYYVDSTNGSDGNDGDNPLHPLLTIAQAISNCQAGDTIIVASGHTETVTTALAMSKARVSLIGLGVGTGRPQITGSGSIDAMTVTGANCLVKGLYFNENASATPTAHINVGAAGVRIVGCHFDQGALDLEAVTLEDAGDDCIIENNTFVVTADGPNAAIEIEAAGVTNTKIRGNHFVCSDGTDAYDAAAVNSTVANTNLLVTDNVFIGAGVVSNAVVAASAVDKTISGNIYGSDAIDVDASISQDAGVDQKTWYVDSVDGDAAFDGLTPQTALVTVAAAITAASAGDKIIIAAGHVETLTAAVAISKAGLSLIGQGKGTRRPTITLNGSVDAWDITAANVLIENIMWNEATDASATASINVGAINAVIRGCHFDLGANDTECITVPAAGDGCVIEDCTFIVTANGPLRAIEIEDAGVDDLTIRNNRFYGGNATNVWDTAAINSGVAHTNCRIHGNKFTHGTAVVVLTSVSTSLWDNEYGVACRPSSNSPLTIWAADGATTVSDGTPEDPTTIVDAVDRATAAGDTVMLLPGTYTITAFLDADVAGLTIKAAHGLGTVEIANDTDDIESVTVTAVGVRIEGIHFTKGINNTTDGTALITTTVDKLTIVDCIIDLEARTNADGISFPTATKLHRVEGCTFTDGATGKSYISDASSASRFEDNLFDCSAVDLLCYDEVSSPGGGGSFRNNVLVSDDTAGALMNRDGSPGALAVVGNYVAGVAAGNVLGSNAALDAYVFANDRETASTPVGEGEAVNPSP